MKRAALIFFGSFALIFAFTAAGVFWMNHDARAVTTHTLDIPPGTAKAIATGRGVLDVPSVWAFYDGDTLELRNRDVVAHNLGAWRVAPGRTLSIGLTESASGVLACSLHPASEIRLDVQGRGFDWNPPILAGLLFGTTLGAAAVAIDTIMRRIAW